MNVRVVGGDISEEEKKAYVAHVKHLAGRRNVEEIVIRVDGDYVDLKYTMEAMPFERTRRITGYLVGTLDRFNDAKRAEVLDRVPHSF